MYRHFYPHFLKSAVKPNRHKNLMEFNEKIEEEDSHLEKMERLEQSQTSVMPHTLIYSTPLLQRPLGKNHLGFTTCSIDSGFAESSFNASSASQRSGPIFGTSSPSQSSASNSSFFSPEDYLATKGQNLYSEYEPSPLREFSSLQGRRLTFEESDIQHYFPSSETDIQFPDLELESCKNIDISSGENDKVEENVKDSGSMQLFPRHMELADMSTSSSSSPVSGSAADLEFSLQEMSLEELTSCSSGSRSSPCCMKQSASQDSLSDIMPAFQDHSTQVLFCDKDCPSLTLDPFTSTNSIQFNGEKYDHKMSGDLICPPHKTLEKQSFQKVLKHYSPLEPSRLIGRNTGLRKFDIIQHLSEHFPVILHRIFDLLSPADLNSVCKVSTYWEKCLYKDTKALRRYKKYLDHMRQTSQLKKKDKENTTEKLLEESSLKILTGSRGLLTALQTQATTRTENKATESNNSFQPYVLTSEDKLRRCPRCQYSAVIKPVEDRATCLKESCGYDFCTKCFAAFHHPKRCKPLCNVASTAGVAGTRKSKKNLKRL